MKFRWPWVTVPGALFLCLWFLSGITPAFGFMDLGALFKVVNFGAYGNLAALCFIGLAVVLLAKLLKSKG